MSVVLCWSNNVNGGTHHKAILRLAVRNNYAVFELTVIQSMTSVKLARFLLSPSFLRTFFTPGRLQTRIYTLIISENYMG